MGLRLKVSSDRLVKSGMEPATPGLQGKWLIHYITAAPIYCDCIKIQSSKFLVNCLKLNSTANIKALRGSLGALSVNKLSQIPKLQPISAVYENQ